MKKRAQPPDAYTYTILLRGLAANHQYPQSLPRALSIYNSMYAENSPVRPSIIHTNAVLKVCSRANDIDALFEVAAKLPKRGKGAPDNLTFTTIINAIWNALLQNPLLSAEQHTVKRQEAVQQGRRMWEDIIGRWRNGDMLVDEEMVCAMARLLMLGDTPEDYDDVLSLFEQTMNIPRLVPRLGDPARQTHLIPSKDSARLSPADNITEATEASSQSASQNSDPDTAQSSPPPSFPSSTSSLPPTVFTPLPLHASSVPRSYPMPSQQTLSGIVLVCTRIHALRAASSYWTLLTTPPHSVVPDADNLHTYLRLLRLSRASRQAVDLVTTMLRPCSAGGLGIPAQPKTFRIAMSTCVRDAFNPSAPAHASAILTAMAAHLEEPDLRACEMFVVVLEKAATTSAWRPVLAGLDALEPVVTNLRSVLSYGVFGIPDSAPEEDLFTATKGRARPVAIVAREDRTVTLASALAVRHVLKRVIGVYDRVLVGGRESFAVKERRAVRERRERLYAFVERRTVAKDDGRGGHRQPRGWGEDGDLDDGMEPGEEKEATGPKAVGRKGARRKRADRGPDEDMDPETDGATETEAAERTPGGHSFWARRREAERALKAQRLAWRLAGDERGTRTRYEEAAWKMGVLGGWQTRFRGGDRGRDEAVSRIMRAVKRKRTAGPYADRERDEYSYQGPDGAGELDEGGRRNGAWRDVGDRDPDEDLRGGEGEGQAGDRDGEQGGDDDDDGWLSVEEEAEREWRSRSKYDKWGGLKHRWEGRGRVSARPRETRKGKRRPVAYGAAEREPESEESEESVLGEDEGVHGG